MRLVAAAGSCLRSGLLGTVVSGGRGSEREGGRGRVLRRSSSLRPMRRKPTESMQACTKMAMASCGVLSCGESSAAAAAGRLASMLRSTVGALNGMAAMVEWGRAGRRDWRFESVVGSPGGGSPGGDDVARGLGVAVPSHARRGQGHTMSLAAAAE